MRASQEKGRIIADPASNSLIQYRSCPLVRVISGTDGTAQLAVGLVHECGRTLHRRRRLIDIEIAGVFLPNLDDAVVLEPKFLDYKNI
jgi:hypothetical protein